ncbi:MAG: protein phosphatase 2C domain-containing protein [Lewinella sp.]|uniref:protein phosphatase 2C domain-containing protein n=1 Tax=Lewinella sp. TaxID=2004506 RepID=UPI003D6B50B4
MGTFHENHCEDYTIFANLDTNRILMAVMDGCTMGKESYFASALFGKILRKVAYEEFHKSYLRSVSPSLEEVLQTVFKKLFATLKSYSSDLNLDKYELLTTLLLGVIDLQAQTAFVQVIGDGLVFCDGQASIFDQENAPDYLGYHLRENFTSWYAKQDQRLYFEKVQDLSLSTDGIFTFSPFQVDEQEAIAESFILDFLLKDQRELGNERMFAKKLYQLEGNYNVKPTDDLGIVRLVLVKN